MHELKESIMRKTAFTISLLLVLTVVAVTAAADPGTKTVPRVILGAMEGRFGFEGPSEGPWTTTGDVMGTLRHLGLAKMTTTHTADPNGTLSDGVFKIVAANGDEIRGSYTASGAWISGTQVLGSAAFTVEGGTGRFAQATGEITAAFLETFDDPTFYSAKVSWTLEGTVRY
jgi:hypothetical protein